MQDTAEAAKPAAKEAPSAKSGGKKLGFAMGALIAAGIALVVLVGGFVAFGMLAKPTNKVLQVVARTPVINMLLPTEKKARAILAGDLEAAKDEEYQDMLFPESGKYAMNVTGEVSDFTGMIARNNKNLDIDISVEGALQEKDTEMDVDMSVSSGNTDYSGSVAIALVDEEMYLRIDELSDDVVTIFAGATQIPENMLKKGLDGVMEQWYEIDASEFGGADFEVSLDGSDLIDDMVTSVAGEDGDEEAVLQAYLDFLAEENASFEGVEELRDRKTYHFKYDVTADDMIALKKDLAEATDEEFTDADEEDLKDSFEENSLDLELWLDMDGQIAKVSASVDADSDGVVMKGTASMEIWEFGEEQDVSKPSDAKTYEELMQDLTDAMGVQ